jgi:TPR repeat protein
LAQDAAKFYLSSAEQGDIIALHFIGMFYHQGFGVSKNPAKGLEYLQKAANQGHAHAMYQLFLIMSGKEGEDEKLFNPEVAYKSLVSCLEYGVTYYEECQKYFRQHYDQLAPGFIKERKVPIELKEENKEDICKMHDAYVNEMRSEFSAALSKDRLYHQAAGFVKDQLSWIIGV